MEASEGKLISIHFKTFHYFCSESLSLSVELFFFAAAAPKQRNADPRQSQITPDEKPPLPVILRIALI